MVVINNYFNCRKNGEFMISFHYSTHGCTGKKTTMHVTLYTPICTGVLHLIIAFVEYVLVPIGVTYGGGVEVVRTPHF